MKKIIYAIGLVSLPFIYVGVMLATRQPIDWAVLGLMALILAPLLFWKVIPQTEKDFDALSEEEKLKKVARAAGKIAGRGD
jgi:hypothetical protein